MLMIDHLVHTCTYRCSSILFHMLIHSKVFLLEYVPVGSLFYCQNFMGLSQNRRCTVVCVHNDLKCHPQVAQRTGKANSCIPRNEQLECVVYTYCIFRLFPYSPNSHTIRILTMVMEPILELESYGTLLQR